ncbi:MAG: transporter substrate-binding domain-containing protein [Lutibacter sp.]
MAKNIYLIFILFISLFQPCNVIAQVYVVGGDSDYAPISYVDKTGKASGLDIDILKAISVKNNMSLSFHLSNWDKALTSIKSGEIDIITGIIFSDEREKFLDFTIPVYTEYYSIFIRKGLLFNDLSNLPAYKLLVLDKDISIDRFLIPMGLYKNYDLAKSLPEALSKIELGLADYIVAPNSPGMYEIEKNGYKNIEIKGPPIIPSIYCIAVKKGNTKLLSTLNNGISELRRNGKLLEIQSKWKVYEKDDYKYERIVKIIGFVVIIAIILIILGFIWVWYLRLQIKKNLESFNLKNQELQKSEEKFRIITENSSDIIWHIDSNFLLTYISRSDERIRGFKKEEIIGSSLFSILKPEGIELIKEANKRRMIDFSNGIASAPVIYELEEICKDGSWVWIEATATAHFDQNGNITGYHGVSRDISERKKAEQLLNEKENQLRELVSTKDKLFSIIAHDLRSPFNAILGLSELLIENTRDFEVAESKKYLGIINSSAKSTLILLDNLLNWAKAQTGQIIYKPEKTNLSTVVREILEISNSIAKLKNISLNYIQTEDIEVYADLNMLKTILRNLISNATKYSRSNGEIYISAVQNKNNIEITISDNGVGMSEETQNKLFKIDTNITTTGTANEKGSGLGLILCKEFVEKHGGKIWAKSELGKGSSFVFSLPFRDHIGK